MFRSNTKNFVRVLSGVKVSEDKISLMNGLQGKILKVTPLKGASAADMKKDLHFMTSFYKNSLLLVTTKTKNYQKFDFMNGTSPGHLHMLVVNKEGKEEFTLSKRADTSKPLITMKAANDGRVFFKDVSLFQALFTTHQFEVNTWSMQGAKDLYVHVLPLEGLGAMSSWLVDNMKAVVKRAEPYQLMSGLNGFNQVVPARNCVQACYEAFDREMTCVETYHDLTPQMATVQLVLPFVKDQGEYAEQVKKVELVTHHELDMQTTRAPTQEAEQAYSLVV